MDGSYFDGKEVDTLADAFQNTGAQLVKSVASKTGDDAGEEKYAVLSDILGDEDHLGDMDNASAPSSSARLLMRMVSAVVMQPVPAYTGTRPLT